MRGYHSSLAIKAVLWRRGTTRAPAAVSAQTRTLRKVTTCYSLSKEGKLLILLFVNKLRCTCTMVYRKKRMHRDNKDQRKRFRTRRYTKDLDQVLDDAKPEAFEKLKHQDVDLDMPGLAQFYCVACA